MSLEAILRHVVSPVASAAENLEWGKEALLYLNDQNNARARARFRFLLFPRARAHAGEPEAPARPGQAPERRAERAGASTWVRNGSLAA